MAKAPRSRSVIPSAHCRHSHGELRALYESTYRAWCAAGGSNCCALPPDVQRLLLLMIDISPIQHEARRLKGMYAVEMLAHRGRRLRGGDEVDRLAISSLLDFIGRQEG